MANRLIASVMSPAVTCSLVLTLLSQGCQTIPASLRDREAAILAAYHRDFAVAPDGPNHEKTHRVIVTLKPGISASLLLRELDGQYFPQQWCLMPNDEPGLCLGMDLARDTDRETLISTLRRELRSARDVRSGASSPYLDRVLGANEWRNVPNFPPFSLLAAHVVSGTRADMVRSLLGKPSRQSPEAWHYETMIGIHATALFNVRFEGDRVVSCDFRTRVQGPPRRR
jgi:hypothetical protein